jgi:hypothetical protein
MKSFGAWGLVVSLSTTATIVEAGAPTWTTFSSSANPSLAGQSVTLTATVRVVGGGGPVTGTVTFKDVGAVLATIAVDGTGKAVLATSSLAIGTHQLTATYNGDGNFNTSSGGVALSVPNALGCAWTDFADSSPANGTLRAVASADFNNDGKPDVLTLNTSSNSLTVLLGDGTGALLPTGSSVAAASAFSVVTADFNLDGNVDVSIGAPSENSTSVSTYLGNGAGALAAAGTPLQVAQLMNFSSADVNLDGRPDLILGVHSFANNKAENSIAVFLGDGSGGFTPGAGLSSSALDQVFGPQAVGKVELWGGAPGDFNGDGRPDLALSARELLTSGERWLLITLLGDGTGALTPGATAALSSFTSRRLKTADLDLDGNLDLVDGDLFSGNVVVWKGNGSGTFTSASFPVLGGASFVTVADFNVDGKPDIGTASGILFGNGASGFTVAYPAGWQAATAYPDLNNDGRVDLIYNPSGVATRVNTCGLPATTTTVSSAPSPSTLGQTVTLTAVVAPGASGATPTGTVHFRLFDWYAPFVTLNGGVATVTTTNLAGVSNITAVYAGNTAFSGSVGSVTHTVLPRLTVQDPSAANSASPTNLVFTITLSESTNPNPSVTVNYATSDRTARAGTDYTAVSGSLTFNPGETTKTVSVPILQGVPGPDKDFFLALSNPTNATLSRSTGIGTIQYLASGAFTITIDDPTQKEGNSGTTLMAFTVALARTSIGTITVDYATSDGTATAGTDYTARSGSLTFLPGKTTRSVLIPVSANTALNSNRTILVTLSNANVGAITKSQGVGTIVDDDPPALGSQITQLRLYSNTTFEHLYTTDTNEYAVLGGRGWNQEGNAYTMFQSAGFYTGTSGAGPYAVPMYRLYLAGIQQHHWTTDWYEAMVLASGSFWDYEGIAGYLLPSQETGTVPLYRLALGRPALHLWTTDANEKNVLSSPSRGWTYEGILGYVIP